MSKAPALFLPNMTEQDRAKLTTHAAARRLVDRVFQLEPGTPKRWRAIQAVWLAVAPNMHGYQHREAVAEAAEVRATLFDKKFGQSEATLNHGRTKEGKQVQHLIVLGVMPQSLSALLKKMDPFGLGMATGKENQKLRRKLYNEFKEYKIPEHV